MIKIPYGTTWIHLHNPRAKHGDRDLISIAIERDTVSVSAQFVYHDAVVKKWNEHCYDVEVKLRRDKRK